MSRALPLLPLLLLAACGGSDVTASTNLIDGATPVAASDAGQGTRFLCADGRTVRAVFADPETLTLHIGATPVAMRAAPAPRGARYTGGGWQWWTNGLQQATLTPLAPGTTAASAGGTSCRVQ